jgi:hypothetical protein
MYPKRIHEPEPGYRYLPFETLKNRTFFTEPTGTYLWRVSKGRYLCRGDQLALVFQDPLGIRRELGIPPKTRCYLQDVMYFAKEHMDVRREASLYAL